MIEFAYDRLQFLSLETMFFATFLLPDGSETENQTIVFTRFIASELYPGRHG